MKKFLLLSLSAMFLFTSCFLEDDKKSKDELKSIVDSYYSAATVKSGISVALYKDGYTWTYAKGDAYTDTKMTADTPGYAYSITKTIVSALVLTQIEEGKYSLTDTVADLLGDNADYIAISADQKDLLNTSATVAQLLSHTSGMLDYASNTSPLIGLCNPAISWKPADILENIVNQPLGTIGDFNYSNTNYVLLGMIAEHKGGADLNDLLASAFFTPLELTIKLSPQDAIPTNLSDPYDDSHLFGFPEDSFKYLTDTLAAVFPTYNFFLGVGRGTWAAGGIMSTAENLAKWGYELYDTDGDAVSAAVRTQLKNSTITPENNYGYGVSYNSFTYDDGTAGGKYGHGGSAPGYKTLLRYETSERICVVIMTNANNIPDSTDHPTYTDSQLGLVDREALADALFNAYHESN